MPRSASELRPVKIKRKFTKTAPGSVLYQCGETVVLCSASVDTRVPPWMEGKGRGWITAEYNMLPSSTAPRKKRDRGGKVDGRTTEIQRLIGRSFRAVANMEALGEMTITVDCDVLQADGGTRTASITGGFIALVDALWSVRKLLPNPDVYPLSDNVAAVSVGIVDGHCVLDLDYELDFAAAVDMNVVMTGSGQFIEIQGTGEEATFSDDELASLLKLAKRGIKSISKQQAKTLGRIWPFSKS
ncbi:MAG TPA: ribonuclease PH [Planctomycetes bacterium]|nr:ribonuclease PH [Planctomycetaceae bacterium]HIM32068.1 ribonuclease PH [Planctomycetota bacterium]